MAISPNSNLFLLKSNLQLSNKHQLTFANKEQQFEFFNSLPKLEIENISYQRKDSVIRFPGHIDSIIHYNYVMYQNTNYDNKWFYAFIVNMEYENNGTTNIYIKTDVWQTWQFDLIFRQSFIDREMIDSNLDIPGNNLQPESFELGDPVIQSSFSSYDFEPAYIIAYSGDQLGSIEINQNGASYNGIYSSIKYILCNEGGFKDLMGTLQNTEYADYIVTCFTVPVLAVKSQYRADLPLELIMDVNSKENPMTYNVGSRPSSLDGYTPTNKKLLTYPFCYLGFNNAFGTPKIYKFEDFTNGTASFEGISEINPNPQIALIPKNYKKQVTNLDEISFLAGYPTVSYKNDNFNSWLARNIPSIEINLDRSKFNYLASVGTEGTNVVGGAISAVAGLFTGNGGAVVGGVNSMANAPINAMISQANYDYDTKLMMEQIKAQALLPDNVTMSSSNGTLLGYNKMSQDIFSVWTIKRQFAERIDKFFSMYGYKTNLLKVPNLTNRQNWNYVKTVGLNVKGDIPQLDLAEIKSIFDNGVTLWHNPNTFLDYSQNNV